MDMRTIETETGKHKEAFELFASAKTGFKTLRSLYESTLRSLVSEASRFASLNLSKPGRLAYMTHLSKIAFAAIAVIGVSHEWREDKQNLERSIAPELEGLQDSAQGFNPGKHSIKRFALEGRKICLDQSHTYRSSKRIPCLFSSARNSS